jgi:hypothetical protein
MQKAEKKVARQIQLVPDENRDAATNRDQMGQPVSLYTYAWGNNERRLELKGRVCRIIAKGRMNTVLVEFIDNNEKVTTSIRALREIK